MLAWAMNLGFAADSGPKFEIAASMAGDASLSATGTLIVPGAAGFIKWIHWYITKGGKV